MRRRSRTRWLRQRSRERRWGPLSRAAAVAATATLLGAAPAGAFHAAADGTSCPPIPAARLHSILGLPQSFTIRNTTSASGDAVIYRCGTGAWSGATPTGFQAELQAAKSGRGALVGIETWAPNDDSPDVDKWANRDYPHLTTHILTTGVIDFPDFAIKRGEPTHRVRVPYYGYLGTGLSVALRGSRKGLVAAVGCWWDNSSSTATCLFVEEAAFHPVVKHLNQLAAIAVPKVLG